MAVTVADQLKPKNGLSFPVVESSDIKGGVHCVATTEERDALLKTDKKEAGMLVYVKGAGDGSGVTYQLNDDLLTFHVFSGEITSEQMQTIMEYVQANIEHSTYTEEEGMGILTLL